MIAFILGTLIAVLTVAMPSLWKTASKAAVHWLSWSRSRYFAVEHPARVLRRHVGGRLSASGVPGPHGRRQVRGLRVHADGGG